MTTMADKVDLKRAMLDDVGGRRPKSGGRPKRKRVVRSNVRVPGEIHDYLKEEAERTGTSIAALMSLAISDWVDNRKLSKSIKAIEETELYKTAYAAAMAAAEAATKKN